MAQSYHVIYGSGTVSWCHKSAATDVQSSLVMAIFKSLLQSDGSNTSHWSWLAPCSSVGQPEQEEGVEGEQQGMLGNMSGEWGGESGDICTCQILSHYFKTFPTSFSSQTNATETGVP